MSFIVTNQTTGQQVAVQKDEAADIQVRAGDRLIFSGGGWQANCTVQVLVGGNTVQWLTTSNDVYGIFQSSPYTVPSGIVNVPAMVYVEGYGSDFPWGNSGIINLISTVPKVTVTFSRTAYGTITPLEGSYLYDENQPITMTATPDPNCVFIMWEYNGGPVSFNPSYTALASDGAAYHAVFALAQQVFTLTVNKSGTGDGEVVLTPLLPNLRYPSGQSVTLLAIPNSGSVFSGWSGALTGSANPTTIIMNGNKVVTATFNLGEAGVEWVGTIPAFKDGTYKWTLTFNIVPIPFLDNYIVDWLSQRPQDEAIMNDALQSQGISGSITITNKEITRHQNAFGNVDRFTITYTYTLAGTGLSLEGQQALVAWIPILVAAIPAIITLLTAVVYLLIINSIVAGITAITGPEGKNVNILVIGGICVAGLLLLKD